MRTRDLAAIVGAGVGVLSGALLVYGALVVSNRLIARDATLSIPGLPEELIGFRIAVIGDTHVRDDYSERLTRRAAAMAVAGAPDAIVLVGDFIGRWVPTVADRLAAALEPLQAYDGPKIAVPGNHDYDGGDAESLRDPLLANGIRLLRNESVVAGGVVWLGIDSEREGQADAPATFAGAPEGPKIVLWHEPDMVDFLPSGALLMISGHSHGGQFVFPGGITPMRCRLGKKYHDGWYPETSTPLFVTSGVGTTGPPSRFGAIPEVAFLTLAPV